MYEKLEITYTLEQNDILHFQKYAAASKSWWEKINEYTSFGVMIAFLTFLIAGQFPHIVHGAAAWPKFAFYVGVPTLISSAFIIVVRIINHHMAHKLAVPKAITIGLSEHGLSRQSGVDTVEIAWSALHDIARDNTHLYFYITKAEALVIPKRAFESLEQAHEFYQMALTYRSHLLSGEAALISNQPVPSPRLQRQVQYTISHADLMHAQKYFQRRKWRFVKSWKFIRVLIGIVLGVLILRFTSNPFIGVYGSSQALGLIAIIVLTGYCVMLLMDAIKNAKNGNKRSPLQTLTVGLSEVMFSVEGARFSIPWTNVKDITMDSRLIYVQIGNLSYDVPREAFGSPEDADDFYEMVKLCWQSAKAGTPLTELPQSQSWPPAPVRKT